MTNGETTTIVCVECGSSYEQRGRGAFTCCGACGGRNILIGKGELTGDFRNHFAMRGQIAFKVDEVLDQVAFASDVDERVRARNVIKEAVARLEVPNGN